MEAAMKILLQWRLCLVFFISIVGAVNANMGTLCLDVTLKDGQLCCNKTVHDMMYEYGRYWSCCNGVALYDKKNKVCCGEDLWDKFDLDGSEIRCCSKSDGASVLDQIFIPDKKEFCCDGIVDGLHSYENPDDFDCCGKVLINVEERTCCRSDNNTAKIEIMGLNEHCCGVDKYNDNSHWCDNEKVMRLGMEMCGIKVFNVTSEVCCYNDQDTTTTVKKTSGPGNWICEYGTVFDSDKFYWNKDLHGTVAIGNQLCNKTVEFNPEFQVCCRDIVFNITNYKECCGSSYYPTISHGCCRDQVYDLTTENCCKNSQKISISTEQNCCGPDVYNPTTQVCCQLLFDDKPILKKKSSDTLCCNYGKELLEPYNQVSEECREDTGVTIRSNDIAQDQPIHTNVSAMKKQKLQSPFCKGRKQEQMKNSCNKNGAFKVWLLAVYTYKSKTTLDALIWNLKPYRGYVARINVTVSAKCMKKWEKRFIWIFTNRRPKGNAGKNGKLRLKVTGAVASSTSVGSLPGNWLAARMAALTLDLQASLSHGSTS